MKPTEQRGRSLSSPATPTSDQTSRLSVSPTRQRSRDEQGKATSRQAVPASPKHLSDLKDGESALAWPGGFITPEYGAMAPGRPPAPFPVIKPTEPEGHSNLSEVASGQSIASGSVSMNQREKK